MAAHSKVTSIDLELEARDDDEIVVTFNRLRGGPRLTAHSYSLVSAGSMMRLNDLVARKGILIYDCIVSSPARIRLNVDVSQLGTEI